MGFVRRQEEKLAARFLIYQYRKQNIPIPSAVDIDNQSRHIVNEAHRIAKERGRNVMTIIKELVGNAKKQ
jgi:hypothetical protein